MKKKNRLLLWKPTGLSLGVQFNTY